MASKYDRLCNHLMALGSPSVIMSFAEIEAVLRTSLPYSARSYRAWWSNEPSAVGRHVQCGAWQNAGYSAVVDIRAESVTFRRSRAS